MLKAKNGNLVALNSGDQELFWEAYLEGGKSIVYRLAYKNISRAHALLIKDSNGDEVCALISKDVTRLVALTHDKLLCDGMELEDFIRQFCPLYVDDLNEMERQKP